MASRIISQIRAHFNANVRISTPLVGDRYGNIFFGYTVLGANPLGSAGGIGKIDYNGVGSFITATAAAGGDASITKIPLNSTPALSNDHQTLYFAVSGGGGFGTGYLTSVDSRNLAPIARVRLKDVKTGADAFLVDDGTASPMVGPDGDVYFGVLENPFLSNNDRGWMLHFNVTLSITNTPGAFGWDDTPSVVSAKLVASCHGSSTYLLMTKYNNYAGIGGDGVIDPNTAMADAISGAIVMKEILTITGPTPDPGFRPQFPNAVREWCINSAAIDPIRKVALANSEDGTLYRRDFTTNGNRR